MHNSYPKLRLPSVLGVVAVDPELPEGSPSRDLASLIGNLELIWEHICEQNQPLFPCWKALLRQKYGLPTEDVAEHWMAPLAVHLDVTFSPSGVLAYLRGLLL